MPAFFFPPLRKTFGRISLLLTGETIIMARLIIYLRKREASWYRNLFWLLLLLIVGVSSIPSLPEPEMDFVDIHFRLDHLFHWGEYTLLTFLFASWRFRRGKLSFSRILLIALVTGSLIASIDEVHQLWIPGRHFTFADWLSNLLGVLTGLLAYTMIWLPERNRVTENAE